MTITKFLTPSLLVQLITLTFSLKSDKDQQSVSSDLDQNLLTFKDFF